MVNKHKQQSRSSVRASVLLGLHIMAIGGRGTVKQMWLLFLRGGQHCSFQCCSRYGYVHIYDLQSKPQKVPGCSTCAELERLREVQGSPNATGGPLRHLDDGWSLLASRT